MALKNCPECNREISDKASACPHCGYELPKQKVSTPLGRVEKDSAKATMYMICGITAIIFGIFTIGIIIGIFAIIGGVALVSMGASNFSGLQYGTCPYCNSSATVKPTDSTYKCPHCQKTSTKTTTHLIQID